MYYYSIGQLLETERLKKGITQSGVCRGLCNVSTYNRYERDEIIPDKYMLDYLLQRLGKNPETINYLVDSREAAIRELRIQIEESISSHGDTEKLLGKYVELKVKRNSNIHDQYIVATRGRVMEANGKIKYAYECYENALKMTNSNIWNSAYLYSIIEFKLLFLLARIEKDYTTVFEMEKYLEKKENYDVLKSNLYTDIIYRIILEAPIDETVKVEYIDKAIEYKKTIVQYTGLKKFLIEKLKRSNFLSNDEKKIMRIEETVAEIKKMGDRYGRV